MAKDSWEFGELSPHFHLADKKAGKEPRPSFFNNVKHGGVNNVRKENIVLFLNSSFKKATNARTDKPPQSATLLSAIGEGWRKKKKSSVSLRAQARHSEALDWHRAGAPSLFSRTLSKCPAGSCDDAPYRTRCLEWLSRCWNTIPHPCLLSRDSSSELLWKEVRWVRTASQTLNLGQRIVLP